LGSRQRNCFRIHFFLIACYNTNILILKFDTFFNAFYYIF
jgi:hypothetical protein